MAARELVIPYQPHPKTSLQVARPLDGLHPQEAFHADRYRIPYRALFAGTGSGKTHACAFETVAWALENPGCVMLAGEPDYPMAERVMYPALAAVLGAPSGDDLEQSPIVKSWNKNGHRLEFHNGTILWFIPLQDEGKIEGPNVDFAWLDEIRLLRKWGSIWKAIRRRLRGSRPGARIGAVISTHSPTKDQLAEFEGAAAKRGRRCYRWTPFDNPELPEDYLRELRADYSGPSWEAVVLGKWAQAEGRVFSEFRSDRHIVHRPDPPIPDRPEGYVPWTERMSYGVDWGHGVPAAIIATAWAGERAVFVDEAYGKGYSIGELIAEAQHLVGLWGRGRFYCGHDRPEHISEFRAAGLDAVSIQSVKGAFVKADGIATMNSMFKSGELGVAPECKNWIWEEERYVWKPGREDQETEKGDDHAQDGGRYSVMGERARPRLVFGTVNSR